MKFLCKKFKKKNLNKNFFRLRSIESAIGLMKNIQTSVVVEENWVEAHTSKLQSLPTATSALELDVSTSFRFF